MMLFDAIFFVQCPIDALNSNFIFIITGKIFWKKNNIVLKIIVFQLRLKAYPAGKTKFVF